MTEEYEFHILQLRYIREAMNNFANYRPDDWTLALIDPFITGAKATRTAFLDAKLTEIAELRRELQYAADAQWPAGVLGNAGTRGEFQIPADKALA